MLPAQPPEEFAVGELVLRAFTGDDWYVDQRLSGEQDVVEWTTLPAELTEERARHRAGRSLAGRAERMLARYVIVEAGQPVGTCGLGAVEDEVEVFYALLPSGRGRGLATAAARTLAEWAQGAGAGVTLLTHPGNTASQRVAVRAGFERDGEVARVIKGAEVTLVQWRFAG